MNPILHGPVLFGFYLESYSEKRGQMDHTKLDQVNLDLDSPLRELSVRDLGFVVALYFGFT